MSAVYAASYGGMLDHVRSMDVSSVHLQVFNHLFLSHSQAKHLLEQEEEAAADQLHLQALLDVAVEQLQQLRDIWERQDQQRNLQLTGDHRTHTHTHRLSSDTAPQTGLT